MIGKINQTTLLECSINATLQRQIGYHLFIVY
jgi:hypothetical protein